MVPSGPGRGSLAVKSALSHRVLLVELIETGPEVDVTVLFGLDRLVLGDFLDGLLA